METIRYGTSLRAVPVQQTLEHARRLGIKLGVTRVTDVTRLDRIGIPVFMSIRPGARHGSLCVNAGKGPTAQEACVDAWMEAIEYALAEPEASPIPTFPVSPRLVLDRRVDPPAILDLCPRLGVPIDLNREIPCVVAEEIVTQTPCFVPAELVFLPAPTECSPSKFGASSNGLASGNTLLEATVHGLTEVIERDIMAFHTVRDTSVLVHEETFPPAAADLAAAIRDARLQLFVRYEPNAFQIPFCSAILVDTEEPSPLFVHGGFGCHPHAPIALVRAICEAAQSRLSFIHGGRDDLVDWYRRIRTWEVAEQTAHRYALIAKAGSQTHCISFEQIPDYTAYTPTLEANLKLLVTILQHRGLSQICRVVFTSPEESLQVVRVIVPLLEEFDLFSSRVGRRLRDYVETDHA